MEIYSVSLTFNQGELFMKIFYKEWNTDDPGFLLVNYCRRGIVLQLVDNVNASSCWDRIYPASNNYGKCIINHKFISNHFNFFRSEWKKWRDYHKDLYHKYGKDDEWQLI